MIGVLANPTILALISDPIMAISDPAQLLQRIPELYDLLEDDKIRHAVASGDPFKVYRALMLAKLFRRLPQHRATLQTLTAERRLFARPLKGSPALGTINSVGFSFVGRAETDVEGYHIALHAFVILFMVPLIPFGAYVVQSTGANQWRIFARAPLGIAGWLYTRGLALGLVLLVLAGATSSFNQTRTHDVIVLNGFKAPITVNMDGQQVQVPPLGSSTITVRVGRQQGTASSAKAGVVDQFEHTVESNRRHTVWNIAGAAPLVLENIVYTKPGFTPPNKPEPATLYCGTRFAEFTHIDFLFTEPPKSLSMGKYESSHTVQHLDLARDGESAGLALCGNIAFAKGEEKDLAKALEVAARLNDWELDSTHSAILAAKKVHADEAIRIANLARRAHPDQINYQRMYRDLRRNLGQDAELLREFGAQAKAHPDSANDQYLYASLSSGTAALATFSNLVQRFPDNPTLLASLCWRKLAHGDYAGGERDLARLHQIDPRVNHSLAYLEARLLLAQHKTKAAMQTLALALSKPETENRALLASDFALIAKQTGEPADQWIGKAIGDHPATIDMFRVRASLPPLQAANTYLPYTKLMLTLRTDPGAARSMAKELPQFQAAYLPAEALILLLGASGPDEAGELNQKIAFALQIDQAEMALLTRFMHGAAVDLNDGDFEPGIQAAAWLVRSRQSGLGGRERSTARQQALQLDFFKGIVTESLTPLPN